jgi:hypothetical protein
MSLRTAPAGRTLALAALLASLSLAGIHGYRGAAPARPAGEPAYLFLSPNTDEHLSLGEVERRLRAPCQGRARQLAGDILDSIGASRHRVMDAIGDWSDGAENSVLAVLPHAPDLATLRYAAVWFGLLAGQKSVLAFHPGPGGPDALLVVEVPGKDLLALRRALDRHAVPFRTIVPISGGHRVIVCDVGGRSRGNLEQLGKAYGARVRVSSGAGVWVGEASRAAAQVRYCELIRAYEAQPSRPRYRPPGKRPAGLNGCGPHSGPLALTRLR